MLLLSLSILLTLHFTGTILTLIHFCYRQVYIKYTKSWKRQMWRITWRSNTKNILIFFEQGTEPHTYEVCLGADLTACRCWEQNVTLPTRHIPLHSLTRHPISAWGQNPGWVGGFPRSTDKQIHAITTRTLDRRAVEAIVNNYTLAVSVRQPVRPSWAVHLVSRNTPSIIARTVGSDKSGLICETRTKLGGF